MLSRGLALGRGFAVVLNWLYHHATATDTDRDRMKVQVPAPSDNGARVIKFTPRTLSTAPTRRGSARPPEADTSRSAGPANHRFMSDRDEFRHRMLMNLAAFVFTAGLTAAGIWLAISIAELQQTQDCALAGHRNCAPLIPSRSGPM
ncbi:MAG: hypothetical protein WBF99_17130 [Xanthobacteraceae bacterium]